jgi:hypothetical protein
MNAALRATPCHRLVAASSRLIEIGDFFDDDAPAPNATPPSGN